MNYLARHTLYCIFLNLILGSVIADRSKSKEVSENRSKNYASVECAKVIESNPEAKRPSHIINGMIDEYMLNPCGAKIWFVIELCDSIQASSIEIASYELYSSSPKDFTVYFSDTYPASAWKPIGHFTASDTRSLQAFDLEQAGFGKFLRVELHSYHGSEHYCVVSDVKVYGVTMMDEWMNEPVNATSLNRPKSKRKTTAYRVYRTMMVDPYKCGLTVEALSDTTGMQNVTVQNLFNQAAEQPITKPILPQPTQQPVTTTRPPLKPSIFVELGNKVKAMESSLKTQIEDIEKRLNEKNEMVKRVDAKISCRCDRPLTMCDDLNKLIRVPGEHSLV